jgi:3-dehydroquinate dehydratase-1
LRIHTEGGAQEIRQELRIACIEAVLRCGAIDLVDVELCNGPDFLRHVIDVAHTGKQHVILSFHDFRATPAHEALFDQISAMVSEGADIAKIACMPQNPADVLRLLQVTFSARQAFPGVPLCMTSMGGLGFLSRVAGFLYGSDMAFAVGAAASAPGQIAIAEARALAEALLRNV